MTEAEGSQRAVRVAIVDDDPFVVQALRSYLSSSPQIEVLSTFTSARDLLAFLKRIPVDVLVSDVRMPGMDGLELLARVQEEHPRTAVVMLTSFDDDSAMLTALSQQANGFLLKDSSPEDVIRAVIAAHSGGTTISPTTTSRLVSQHLRPRRVGGHPDLTEAEQAVLDLLCEGYSNAEIAGRLVVAESTVKTHVSNLMKKYGTPSRLKLVVAVHQLG
ncbi:response regulator transcription factor [Arachnia propionica]|uniref:Response regulator transcription factor n=1 Tax=Arachnia propionica TaxID=1750 RepID=A0AB37HYG7_9ACTN|nr:response regulator transcription factor [Arachnia propionica]AFN45591.1 response regulator receiver domain protein [Arachnia propionica F0230a]QCT36823.1 response regulator transcription factor [Arachnia propionica]QUC10838.1 response regulator transcription factor [Arachnia propionica]RPA17721.1 DNA-binding response regulator [Arachnia propionica]